MKIITKLLEFRGMARRFFQKYQLIIEPVFRFVISYLAFHTINTALAYNTKVASPVIELALAAVGAFLPPVVLILMCALLAILQVYSASPILAALVVVIFAVLYCFIARFSGQYGYAVVAVPILFVFKMPYLIPLLLGMIATPMAIFPTVSGVIIYFVFKVIQEAATRQDITSLDATLALYIDVVNSLFKHKEMFITAAIFAVVILVMWLVRRMRFEFVFEITIVLGAIINILGFLLANLQMDINVGTGSMILGTVVSMLLVFVAQFFRVVLDYTSVEHVQFEDDDYYYYVKAVPKIDVAMLQKNVTTFSDDEEEPEEELTAAEQEEEDFDFAEHSDEIPEEEELTEDEE
ncbi:MAG: hypothetical protein J6K15_06410 [Lachnospiraceae bacterium]|nr:hypothetical protein [Lachnospiraceae bacterium]MBP3577725.1 hypothetical protein [Lachnospiraceae bacterium]